MLQNVERLFIVRITVAVVGAQPVAGKVSLGGFVQAGSQLVGLSVPGESVSTPTSGAMPHTAATGCINVDADDKGVVGFMSVTDSHAIDAPAAFLQRDVLLLGHDERCVVTTALQMLHDGASNFHPPPSCARVTPSSSTRPSPTTASSSLSSKPPKASPTVSPAPTAGPPESSSLRNPLTPPSTSTPTTWPRMAPPTPRPEDLLPLLLCQQLQRREVWRHAGRVQMDRC